VIAGSLVHECIRVNAFDRCCKREKEVALMICDRSFGEGGSFLYPSLDPSLRGKPGVRGDYMEGVLGDVVLVNGVPWPFMEVSNTRYRFRILNASNARRYGLALEPNPSEGAPFVQVGSDGGYSRLPSPTARSPSPRQSASTWS
jgi:FtsP/CotA-like multicopper oxidase with cupredoxin domain